MREEKIRDLLLLDFLRKDAEEEDEEREAAEGVENEMEEAEGEEEETEEDSEKGKDFHHHARARYHILELVYVCVLPGWCEL